MVVVARLVARHRRWVLLGWLLLAVAGAVAAPRATARLSYDFSLPGQPGYETNNSIVDRFGSGGDNAPILLVVGDGSSTVAPSVAAPIVAAAKAAAPGARIASFGDTPQLRGRDGKLGVIVVYPRAVPGADPYATALPALEKVAARMSASGPRVVVTAQDALAEDGGGGGASALIETLFGGLGALVVLVLIFGSFLALMPLLIACARS